MPAGKVCWNCKHLNLDRPAPGAQVVKGQKTGRTVTKYPCAKRGGGRFEPTDTCRGWEEKNG